MRTVVDVAACRADGEARGSLTANMAEGEVGSSVEVVEVVVVVVVVVEEGDINGVAERNSLLFVTATDDSPNTTATGTIELLLSIV